MGAAALERHAHVKVVCRCLPADGALCVLQVLQLSQVELNPGALEILFTVRIVELI